jgi:hypothetical protein
MPKQLTSLSLGAGVQSTALLLLAVEGRIARPDFAVFADTGWEPKGVYDHLDRLEREVAQPAGIEIVRVRSTAGTGEGIRSDSLVGSRTFKIPAFAKLTEYSRIGAKFDPSVRPMMLRRGCTEQYKLLPIFRECRKRLGAAISASGAVGPVPAGSTMTQQVGISTDEFQRARTSPVPWVINSYPLLDIGWSREKCINYLESAGWGSTQKSACVGCPFHSNAEWRRLRDTDPDSWTDAVEFDEAFRDGPPLDRTDGTRYPMKFYLHPSGLPLTEAPIDRRPKGQQLSLLDQILDDEGWSCSPHGCRTEAADFKDGLSRAGGIDVDNSDGAYDLASELNGLA